MVENNIKQYVKNQPSGKFGHKQFKNDFDENYDDDIENNEYYNHRPRKGSIIGDNICGKLTEIGLFRRIFEYFSYDDILNNICLTNKLFYKVSTSLLDIEYSDKLYMDYFNLSIYKINKSNNDIRIDYMKILNVILLQLLDKIVTSIDIRYKKNGFQIPSKNLNNNDDNKEDDYINNDEIIDYKILHDILGEIFGDKGNLCSIILANIKFAILTYKKNSKRVYQ